MRISSGVLAAAADRDHPRLLELRVALESPALGRDAVEQVVLVAAAVVDEEDRLAVARPEVLADRAHFLLRERLRLRRIGGGRHPDVQHAVARGDPRDPLAIGADESLDLAGVAEEGGARDQLDLGHLRDRDRRDGGGENCEQRVAEFHGFPFRVRRRT
jgi:hypothetical protein